MKKIFITETQRKALRMFEWQNPSNGKFMLNEENATIKKKVVNNILQYMNSQLKRYAQTPLNELPYWLQQALNPGGHQQMYISVANNTNGCNRFIDFLRINFYSQFGINRNNGPIKFAPGISRIVCGPDCGYYSFSPYEMNGGRIMKLARLMKMIDRSPDIMLNGISLDSDLNGMSYAELMRTFKDNIRIFIDNENSRLDNTPHKGNGDYKVYEIADTVRGAGDYNGSMVKLTPQSKKILNHFSKYTDWCICGGNGVDGDSEYEQYVSNGGKFYILAQNGYENVPKKMGENCPLDRYGLSLLAVLVGTDGFADSITTRWNHENGGENPNGLWQASQIQKLLHFDFRSLKPRDRADLAGMHLNESKAVAAQDQVKNKVNAGIMDAVTCGGTMEEGAEPESDTYGIGFEGNSNNEYGHVCETDEKMHDFRKELKPIAKFMKDNGLNVYPYPRVKLDWSEQDGLFIKTGHYEPETKTVVLNCNGRHPKDILRTFAHEMIHHSQNLDGKDLNFTSADDVKDNKRLEKLEAEAYLKGNVFFRKWTEYERGKGALNESVCMDEVTDPKSVDLSSFDIKKELNPKFWKNEKLDSRVRIKLLDIADDFVEFLETPWVKPTDIIITGSLANFNWDKKYSDIDLHILMDFSKVDKRTDFVKNYFNSQKSLWNEKHDGIKIMGFPVEVYVQDINEPHASSGVYSLDKNKWLTEPKLAPLAKSKIDKPLIQKRVAEYIDKIDNLCDIYKKHKNDGYEMQKVYDDAIDTYEDIKKERAKGLSGKKTEMTNGNIIYKSLRRLGYIEKIFNLRYDAYDKLKSLS